MVDRGPAGRRGLRLWPVGTVLTLAFVAALVVAAMVFWAAVELLDVQGLKAEARLTSKTLFDLVKLSFGVVAGSGALVALVVAYRRQRVDEDGALRETTRLHTERFTAAVTQLGDPATAVRLGGVHALSGLADDAPTKALRQTCIDVLCAYLRLPYSPDPGDADEDARHDYLALREVRHTVIRLVRDHLRLAADHPHSWQGHDFDFTNVVFDGGDWSNAQFSGGLVSFDGAVFSSGLVSFDGAVFSGGRVSFNGAGFDGGEVSFDQVAFSGGTVQFFSAFFHGGEVTFACAEFSDGEARFDGGVFSGGEVTFDGARFSGSRISFFLAGFFDCRVSFDQVEFSSGRVTFNRADFSGGRVTFNRAEFSGAVVDLRSASGNAPEELIPAEGGPMPSGLLLPELWYRSAQGGR